MSPLGLLTFSLRRYLNGPVQGVHDLPDGESEDVHTHQQAHRSVQFPGLQSLPPLFLFLFLCEDCVDPPDFGKHGAIAQTKAQTQEPEAGLADEGELVSSNVVTIQPEGEDSS